MQTFKCVVVGDEGVGKTFLLTTYATNKFPTEDASVFNNYAAIVEIGKKPYALDLFDIDGQESNRFEQTRQLSYAETDVFLVCYSVVVPSSYERVKEQWAPEVRRHSPKTPFIIVGTQIDRRDDSATVENLAKNKRKPYTLEDGKDLAKELNAVKYVECSAKTLNGLKNVFDEAILARLVDPLESPSKRQRKD